MDYITAIDILNEQNQIQIYGFVLESLDIQPLNETGIFDVISNAVKRLKEIFGKWLNNVLKPLKK